jgi:hypothetical protein
LEQTDNVPQKHAYTASIQVGFSAKAIGFGGTSKPNARRFPMEFKTFSNGNQIVFQWKLKRFPMENETNFNES